MSETPLKQLLENAVSQHQAGNVAAAEEIYYQVLDQDPGQHDALNLLGVIAHQTGNLEKALTLFEQAITAAPNVAAIHFNKGKALYDADRLEAARTAYQTALDYDPALLDAHLNLGVVLQESGQTIDALKHFNTVLTQTPGHQQAHYNIGRCHHTQNRFDDAVDAFTKALILSPSDYNTHFAIANSLYELTRYEEAIEYIKNAIKLKPNWPQAYSDLGLLFLRINRTDEAISAIETATSLEAQNCEYKIALGVAYLADEQNEHAAKIFASATKQENACAESFVKFAEITDQLLGPRKALQLLELSLNIEKIPPAFNSIANAIQSIGLHALAAPYYEAALELDPHYSNASIGLGYLNLKLGRFEEGWRNLSNGLSNESFTTARGNHTPHWNGEDISTKTVLVYFTDGLGEHIIQSTLINDILRLARHCIFECSRRLVPILQRTYPNAEIISGYDKDVVNEALSRADFQTPALHMGGVTRTSFKKFPVDDQQAPLANPDLVREYREKYLEQADGKRIVGLSWISGNPRIGKYKTVELDALEPILNQDNMYIVNLQYGSVSEAINEFTNRTGVKIYSDPSVDQIAELEHFFAQVAAMDLVITISNSAAHVAGSLAVPTWIMLPIQGTNALWYWFRDRTDSPWYPSARLFRQQSAPAHGQPWWPDVVEEVATELQQWLAKPLALRP